MVVVPDKDDFDGRDGRENRHFVRIAIKIPDRPEDDAFTPPST